MGPAEWLGAASLAVALAALVVAGIAAANQLASLKRPLPTVDLMSIEHLDYGISKYAGSKEEMFVAGLMIRVTNRGHEPMLHPMVYDWTEGLVLTSLSKRKNAMPSVLGAGQNVQLVTNYSVANDNDRIIGVVWQEASLFRRKPITMGVRYRLSNALPGQWNAPPVERWTRTGPFKVKGWQKTAFEGPWWKGWQLQFSKQKPMSHLASWGSIQDQAALDIYDKLNVVASGPGVFEQKILGRPDLTPEEIERMHELGEDLPA